MKKVNLVLSGGGARGLAHVGILKVLEEEGIVINRIAGTSAGALIGALYASCKDAQKVEAFVKGWSFYKLPDFSLSKQGLIKGDRLMSMAADFMGVSSFEKLKIPLIVNATDIQTGQEVVFKKGPLLPAIRASIGYPGVLTPFVYKKKLLSDGGLVNPVPLSLLSSRLPVVISDVTTTLTSIDEKSNVVSLLKQSMNILQDSLIESSIALEPHHCVHIRPDVAHWNIFEVKNDPKIINQGVLAARAALPHIRRLLA